MKTKKITQLAADFETYVSDKPGQTETEVWSAAFIDLSAANDPSEVVQVSSLDTFMEALFKLKGNLKVYFHNEKFDGTFILTWLLNNPNFRLNSDGEALATVDKENPLPDHTFTYCISRKGQWYFIEISEGGRTINIVDSAKIAPMSLKKLGHDFKTEHQKLEMEYKGERHAGYTPTDEELAYIKNDVLVLKEVLNELQSNGLDGMTIGSICLKEYKKTIPGNPKFSYRDKFPDLTELVFDETGITVDEYIRKSYHGGWCFCKKNGAEVHARPLSQIERKAYEDYKTIINENKKVVNPFHDYGMTFDVNSLYPSMMQSESGNVYPYGLPYYSNSEEDFNVIKRQALRFYFVHFVCHFKLKEGKLPTVQIKHSMMFNPKKWLESSDVILEDGTKDELVVELTMAKPDFELFLEQYDIEDFEFLDFIYFKAKKGMFDEYIDKWSEVKRHSKGAMRTIAKLMLNNLYGKFAASMDSSYKIAYLNEEGSIRFRDIDAYDKEAGYIAIGSAITSYARCFTIRAAQANYGMFYYADTDSIHLFGDITKVKGIKVHPTDFNSWKMETCWSDAVFSRQKTYIERVTHEDGVPVEDEGYKPYYNIKCAGMGQQAKMNLNKMLTSGEKELSDFKPGLVVPGNLKAKLIPGGALLVESDYKMREDLF